MIVRRFLIQIIAPGESDERHLLIRNRRSQFLGGGKAIHVQHGQIHDDGTGGMRGRLGERLLRSARDLDLAIGAEADELGQRLGTVAVVIDHEHDMPMSGGRRDMHALVRARRRPAPMNRADRRDAVAGGAHDFHLASERRKRKWFMGTLWVKPEAAR